MAEQIDLVYPLYSDVPMMTSFVAALEDGIAYGSDVTQMKNQKRTVAAEGEGKAGAGIPGMGIFSTLLNIDLRGKIQGEQAAGSDEEVKLVRRHTEASLFMRLRHILVNDNRILQIQELDDLEQLENAEQDYLVEIRGQISRSSLNESLETVFRMLDMLGVDLSSNAKPQQGQGGGGKQGRGQQQQRSTSLADQFRIDDEGRMGLQLMQRIREDLTQSKVLDVVLHPSDIENLSVVVALALEFLPEGALDNMLSGDFSVLGALHQNYKLLQEEVVCSGPSYHLWYLTPNFGAKPVLGKVTRLINGSDEISLYQRTVFKNLDSESLDEMFDGLRKSPLFKLPDNPSSIQAPALQIIPLAIYA